MNKTVNQRIYKQKYRSLAASTTSIFCVACNLKSPAHGMAVAKQDEAVEVGVAAEFPEPDDYLEMITEL